VKLNCCVIRVYAEPASVDYDYRQPQAIQWDRSIEGFQLSEPGIYYCNRCADIEQWLYEVFNSYISQQLRVEYLQIEAFERIVRRLRDYAAKNARKWRNLIYPNRITGA
jgi:hypothetical protein